MATAKCFEELEVWISAKQLSVAVYKLTNTGDLNKDFGLKDQMRRASVSIISNIAEGFERNGNKEFIQFLSIAKGSAGELRAQIYLANELEYLDKETFNLLLEKTTSVSKMLSGLINYLKQSELSGSKYKVKEL